MSGCRCRYAEEALRDLDRITEEESVRLLVLPWLACLFVGWVVCCCCL